MGRPAPASRADRARWEWSSLVQRVYEDAWVGDLIEELRQFYSPEVLQRITHPDTSRNPKKACDVALNVMYAEPFTLTITADEQPDFSPLALSRYVPMRQKGHGYTVAMNESILRLDWLQSERETTGRGISYRVASAAYVTAIATQDRPDVPVAVCEQRERYPDPSDPDRSEWTWETWDVRDPAHPVFRIEVEETDANGTKARRGVTARYMPLEWDGAYPYRDKAGAPILPYVLFHALPSDRLWNERHRAELVEGTLKVGCLFTFWLHGFRDAAHPQRVGIDVVAPQAAGTGGTRSTDRISLDQTSILLFNSKNGSGGSLDTLDPAMDPEKAMAAIMSYERGLYVQDGLAPESGQDLSRVSGYALVVSRESLRQRQRQMIPACRAGDQLALATAARLVNAYEGADLPEDPEAYGISYHAIPKSLEETRADVERVTMLRNMPGKPLISWRDAMLALHPHLTPEQADQKLVEIDREGVPEAGNATDDFEMTDPSSGASPSAGRAAAPTEPVPQGEQITEPPDEADTGALTPPTEAVADTALNGAQVSSMLEVLDAVRNRRLPATNAKTVLLVAFRVAPDLADGMLAGLDQMPMDPAPQPSGAGRAPPAASE